MSWLGKILTFVVLIASLVWAYFTVTVYVTRTNWKVRADNYEKAYKDSEANRQRELRDTQAEKVKLVALVKAEELRTDTLKKQLKDLAAEGDKLDEQYKKLITDYMNADVQAKLLAANLTVTLNELADLQTRNTALEDNAVKLRLAKADADRERLRAENEAKIARTIAEDHARKIELLTAQVTDLKQTGGGTGAVIRSLEGTPAPLPEGIRGTVELVRGEFVYISIGIDAGLQAGSKLDVYRLSGGGEYLGTLTVTSDVFPKEAIATFSPKRGVPLSQLRPEELPRKGDSVGQLSKPR